MFPFWIFIYFISSADLCELRNVKLQEVSIIDLVLVELHGEILPACKRLKCQGLEPCEGEESFAHGCTWDSETTHLIFESVEMLLRVSFLRVRLTASAFRNLSSSCVVARAREYGSMKGRDYSSSFRCIIVVTSSNWVPPGARLMLPTTRIPTWIFSLFGGAWCLNSGMHL